MIGTMFAESIVKEAALAGLESVGYALGSPNFTVSSFCGYCPLRGQ